MTYCRAYSDILVISIILLLRVCRITGQLDQSVCIPHQQTGFQPRFVIPGNFSTRIECQLLHKNLTINMEEFHDETRSRGALVVNKMGTTSKVIYNNQDMQILFIKKGECSVFPIPVDVNRALMWIPLPGTGLTVFTTIGLMNMTSVFPFKLGHSRRIRGLFTTPWTACIYLDVHNVTLSITLFFTNSRYWQVSSAAFESLVLARAEVIGRFASPKPMPALSRDFHMIYDYYDYSPDAVLDDILFQPDPGIYCPGRLDGPEMPSFPTAFRLSAENIEQQTNSISNYDVAFDRAGKLARTIEVKLGIRAPYSLSKVYDYNTGMIYTIDSRHGGCSASPIMGFEPFTMTNSNPPSMIRGADYFMSSDGNTQHVGKRHSRGMLCEVWVGVTFDIKRQRNVTVEWYFANTKIHLEDKPGQMITTRNIMHLDPSTPHWSAFDITECYIDPGKRLRFVIEFHVTSGNASSLNMKHLVDNLISSLITVTYLHPIRIQQAEVLYRDPSEVFFVATLLDRAPHSNPYFHVPNNSRLRAAYQFMQGVIRGGLPIMVSSTAGQMMLLRAIAIREVKLTRELITTADPTTSTQAPTTPVSSTLPTPEAMDTPPTKSSTSTTVSSTSQSTSTILTPATTSDQPTSRTSELRTVTSLATSETSMGERTRPLTEEAANYSTSSTTPTTTSKGIPETLSSSPHTSEKSSICSCPAAVTCPPVSCPVITCPVTTCPVVSTCTCQLAATCPTVTCPLIPCPTARCPIAKCSTVPQSSHLPRTTQDVLLCTNPDRKSSAGIIVGTAVGGVIGGLLTGLLIAMLVGRYRRHSKDGLNQVLLNFYINDDAKL